MDAPDDTTPPDGFDLQRGAPSRSGERWMVRADDGRVGGDPPEVHTGHGADDAIRCVTALERRYEGRVGARIELHTEKDCGHLHLHALVVFGHDGAWSTFLCPLATPEAFPLLRLPLPGMRSALVETALAEARITSKGGRA